MSKIVVIKNNMFAAGLNQLAQEIIDLADCPAILPNPVSDPTLLPTNWNGLGAPAPNTIGIVDQGAGAGIYRYQFEVDGLAFDHWLDSKAALRGVTYYRDSVVAGPARISVLNGDDAAAVVTPARNWVPTINVGGSITDVGAGLTAAIRLTCGANSNGTEITFSNLDEVPGVLLIVAKLNYIGPPPVDRPSLGGYMQIQDSVASRTWTQSWVANGQINQLASTSNGLLGNPQGPGYAHAQPFERFDFLGSCGFVFAVGNGLVQSASGSLKGISFDRGFIPAETEIDTNFPQAESFGFGRVRLVTESGSPGFVSNSIDIQELHVLRVLDA